MELEKVDIVVLWILRSAQIAGLKDLSKMQVNKLVYMLDVEAREFMGKSFFGGSVTFVREDRGPISFDVYDSLDKLVGVDLIKKEITDGVGYTAPRHGYSLNPETNVQSFSTLTEGELYFLASVVNDYILLNQKDLTNRAYATNPMTAIISEEKGVVAKGKVIDMDKIIVNPEVMEMTYAGD